MSLVSEKRTAGCSGRTNTTIDVYLRRLTINNDVINTRDCLAGGSRRKSVLPHTRARTIFEFWATSVYLFCHLGLKTRPQRLQRRRRREELQQLQVMYLREEGDRELLKSKKSSLKIRLSSLGCLLAGGGVMRPCTRGMKVLSQNRPKQCAVFCYCVVETPLPCTDILIKNTCI